MILGSKCEGQRQMRLHLKILILRALEPLVEKDGANGKQYREQERPCKVEVEAA